MFSEHDMDNETARCPDCETVAKFTVIPWTAAQLQADAEWRKIKRSLQENGRWPPSGSQGEPQSVESQDEAFAHDLFG
jgi:hypothetical protein